MTAWSEYFAYNVTSGLEFSEDFDMLKEGKLHRYIPARYGFIWLLTIASQTPWIRPLMNTPPKGRGKKKSPQPEERWERLCEDLDGDA